MSSCQAEDVKDDDINTIDGINIWNYPITDGSDSTDPLRTILMCKLLGFSYQWEDYTPFLQNPEDGPKSVVPNYTCSETEKNHLQSECLKHNNTHNSLVNLIDDKIEIALTARGLSRDEVAYANEKGVEIIEKPIAIGISGILVGGVIAGCTHMSCPGGAEAPSETWLNDVCK